MVLAPYPTEFISSGALRDGTRIRIRPVRPEDEPRLQDIVAHMTPEDVRFRFLAPMRQLLHTLAARLARINYEREMALIAFPESSEVPLGVVRYSAEPEKFTAEFALTVRSDWKNRGLGYLLMTRLIEIARQRGVRELFGIVDIENGAMLELCRSLDFTIAGEPGEVGLVRVTKTLSAGS